MSVRRKTNNRMTLFRDCFICGKRFSTTADTPFVRQVTNVKGKKQATVYFCSATCKAKSYKHLFDGKADERRKEREKKGQKKRIKDIIRNTQRKKSVGKKKNIGRMLKKAGRISNISAKKENY